MSRQLHVIAIGALIMLGVMPLALPAQASSDPGWGVAQLLETDDTAEATYPQLAVDSEGNAITVWSQSDGAMEKIWSNRYEIGVGWGTACVINPGGGSVYDEPQVAMDVEGNAIAIWTQYYDGSTSVFSNRYVVGSGWGVAEVIEDNNFVHAHNPRLAMNSEGIAVAVWTQDVDIWSNRYTVESGWGMDELVETGSSISHIPSPTVAVDSEGNAIYVWSRYDGTCSNVSSKRYDIQLGWGTTELLETDDERDDAALAEVAVDSDGNAVAVWNQGYTYDYRNYSIFTSRYVAGSGWEPAMQLGIEDADDECYPQVAMDAEGNAIIVWNQCDDMYSRSNISASRFVVGSGCGPVVRLDSGDSGWHYRPEVAVDSAGNAFAVWLQEDSTGVNIWSSQYAVGTGWSMPMLAESESSGDAERQKVGMDENGNAIAVWHHHDGAHYSIWSNRYVSPPEPSSPLFLQSAPGDGYVNLTWQAPSFDGTSTIQGFRVYRGTSPGTESFLEQIGVVLYYNDTGLTNGVTYYYQVAAFNSVGEGPRSNEVSAKPTGISVSTLTVEIGADPSSGRVPLEVSFTCSVTGGVGPYAYLWNFDDGSTSSLQNPEHTFDSAGTYRVNLRVTDSLGNSTQETIDIEITKGGGGSTESLPIFAAGIVVVVAAAIAIMYLIRWRGKNPPAA